MHRVELPEQPIRSPSPRERDADRRRTVRSNGPGRQRMRFDRQARRAFGNGAMKANETFTQALIIDDGTREER